MDLDQSSKASGKPHAAPLDSTLDADPVPRKAATAAATADSLAPNVATAGQCLLSCLASPAGFMWPTQSVCKDARHQASIKKHLTSKLYSMNLAMS